jgi:hypothetical protein
VKNRIDSGLNNFSAIVWQGQRAALSAGGRPQEPPQRGVPQFGGNT